MRDTGIARLYINFDLQKYHINQHCFAVRYMFDFSEQLRNIIAYGFRPTCVVDETTNETLIDIVMVAHNLKDRSHRLEKTVYTLQRQAKAREHEIFAPIRVTVYSLVIMQITLIDKQ